MARPPKYNWGNLGINCYMEFPESEALRAKLAASAYKRTNAGWNYKSERHPDGSITIMRVMPDVERSYSKQGRPPKYKWGKLLIGQSYEFTREEKEKALLSAHTYKFRNKDWNFRTEKHEGDGVRIIRAPLDYVAKPGQPSKYDWAALEIGKSFSFDRHEHAAALRSANGYRRRNLGWNYTTAHKEDGETIIQRKS